MTVVRRLWVGLTLLIVVLVALGAVGLIERFSATTLVFVGVSFVLSAFQLWGPSRFNGHPSRREQRERDD